VKVHYTGRLDDGRVFDSSIERDPFEVQLGAQKVIPGWEEGLLGMCVGEKRTIRIPPSKGYGVEGIPSHIPGNAHLTFDLELIELNKVGEQLFGARHWKAEIGFLVIVGGFIALVVYVLRTKPEFNTKKPKRPDLPKKREKRRGVK